MTENIVIHRLTGDGDKKILISPIWSCNKRRVLNLINHRLKEKNIICKQGKKYVVTQDAIRNGYGRIKDKIVDGTNRCTSRYTEKLRDLLVKELNN